MKTLLLSAAVLAAAIMPTAASAQAVPAAVIAVVDLERVTASCNACKTANAALTSQVNALKTRQQTLAAPLSTEGQALEAAGKALNGKAPDAALQARAKAYQTKLQQAQQEMARRGANVLLEAGTTLASSNSVDVTNDVLAGLNSALPTIATTAPATQQPQGR